MLLNDVIKCVSEDSTSLVESAFELIVMKGGLERPVRLRDRRVVDEEALEEFADQCVLLATRLESAEEEEEEESEDD